MPDKNEKGSLRLDRGNGSAWPPYSLPVLNAESASGKEGKSLFYFINGLTVSRVVLGLLTTGLVLSGHRSTAFCTFLLGCLTDLLDGHLARKHGLTSEIGKTLDLLADLTLIYGTIISLFILGEFSPLVQVIILIDTLAVVWAIVVHARIGKSAAPSRRLSTTLGSYLIYITSALFIIDSAYKYQMFFLTFFIMSVVGLDFFFHIGAKAGE